MIRTLKLLVAAMALTSFALFAAGCGSNTSPSDIPAETKAAPKNPDADAGPAPTDPNLVPGPKKPGMGGPPPNATGGATGG